LFMTFDFRIIDKTAQMMAQEHGQIMTFFNTEILPFTPSRSVLTFTLEYFGPEFFCASVHLSDGEIKQESIPYIGHWRRSKKLDRHYA